MRPRHPGVVREVQNYFISFTDLLVGVLFIFIILIMAYALSGSSEREAIQRKQQVLENQISLLEGRVELRKKLLKDIAAGMARKGYGEVEINYDDGVIRFKSDQFFDVGSDKLKPGAFGLLDALAKVVAEKMPCYVDTAPCTQGVPILEAVYIEGHTDRQLNLSPDGSDGNWPLSSNRAHQTFRFLTERAPVLSSMTNSSGKELLSISAYAATRELERAEDSARNRRIEIRFLLAAPRQVDLDRARSTIGESDKR